MNRLSPYIKSPTLLRCNQTKAAQFQEDENNVRPHTSVSFTQRASLFTSNCWSHSHMHKYLSNLRNVTRKAQLTSSRSHTLRLRLYPNWNKIVFTNLHDAHF